MNSLAPLRGMGSRARWWVSVAETIAGRLDGKVASEPGS